jgi:hypothetical protein
MDQVPSDRERRGTMLSVAFSVMGGGLILFFLFLACGGLWLYVLAVVAAFTLIGCIHYLLWGYALSVEARADLDKQASEADDQIPDREEAREWTPEERSWYRRF